MAIAGASDISMQVVGAIRQAAQATGTGFEYLLKTAMRESNFNPNAKASTSSATGLFQFIDQTWLATLKESGGSLGYGSYAAAIKRNSWGRYVVGDPAVRRQVMNLRYDPTANAAMAGAFTKKNAVRLTKALGRAPTDGELYIAHFLGQAGAVKFISAAQQAPQGTAASLFPNAARANRSIFFDKQGGARSLAQVYASLVAKHDGTTMPASIASAIWSAPAAAPTTVVPATDRATAPVALAAVSGPATSSVSTFAPEAAPKFNSLFSADRTGPVSNFVQDLWGADPTGTQTTAAVPPADGIDSAPPAAGRIGTPVGLFQFLRPGVGA